MNHIAPTKRRLTATGVALALLFSSVVVFAAAAGAYSCSGNYYMDGTSWADNQWWGDDCSDNHGEMVRAIQVIVNETSTGQGCWTGDDDGYWGSTTKAGVQCYQSWKGLTSDGVVGPATWGQRSRTPYTGLMSEIVYQSFGGPWWGPSGMIWYHTDFYDDRFYLNPSTGRWYLFSYCDDHQMILGHAGGPLYSGCVPPWW